MDLVKIFKALADETRLKIIGLLKEKNYCVNALARKLGISAPGVSQHLKILKDAGLVKGQKRGYYVHYSLDREGWKELIEAFNNTYGEQFLKELGKNKRICCKNSGTYDNGIEPDRE